MENHTFHATINIWQVNLEKKGTAKQVNFTFLNSVVKVVECQFYMFSRSSVCTRIDLHSSICAIFQSVLRF